MLSEEVALVGGVDHQRVVFHVFRPQGFDDASHVLVDGSDRSKILVDEMLIGGGTTATV